MDVKVYHNKEKSVNKLLTFSIVLDPKIDDKLMQITNQLIREGWELVYIKDSESIYFFFYQKKRFGANNVIKFIKMINN